jgi:P-type Ca2+ transporter type 2C
MASNDDPNNKDLCIFIKGAPERILNRCSKILVDGKEMPFDKNCREEVNHANSSFGK